ncbi:MAG: DNA modification methylase [Novosphingobium sp.]|nr:DNA modification methylase [Novosphingobium sp.]
MTSRHKPNHDTASSDIATLINDNIRLGGISYRAPGELRLYDRQLKNHPEEQIVGLMASMRTFGCVSPVLIDEHDIVIDGEALVISARRLAMREMPTIRIDHLDPNEVRLLRLALKKLGIKWSWNDPELAIELGELLVLDLDISLDVTGFSFVEIDNLISSPEASGELEATSPPEPIEPGPAIAQLGDLWVLGQHKLLCGSSLERSSFERLMGSEQAQMVMTDAPYNVKIAGNVSGLGKAVHREFLQASGEQSDSEFEGFLAESMGAHGEFCCDGALLYMFMDWRHGGEMYRGIEANDFELKNVAVWVKPNGGMGSLYRSRHELVFIAKKGTALHRNCVELGKHGRYRTNCWEYPGMNSFGAGRDELLAMHPTVKNLDMIADAIRDVTYRGEIVLDGFAGSGTTLMAAEKTGRVGRCIELDPLYVDCIIRRWEKATGEKARLGHSGGTTFEDIAETRASDSTAGADEPYARPEISARPRQRRAA